MDEGDKTSIEFRLRGETATLEINWKGVCLTCYNEDFLRKIGLSWSFEASKVPGYDLTDYTVKIQLKGTGASIPCADLEYDSSIGKLHLKQVDRLKGLVIFSGGVRESEGI